MNVVGIVIIFVAYAINRFVMTEATKKLDDADKLRLFDVFSKRNNYTTVLLLVLILLYFGAIQYLPHFTIQITGAYLIVFFLYLIIRFFSNYKKLKQMEMPAAYIKSFMISYSVFIIGFLGMAFCSFGS